MHVMVGEELPMSPPCKLTPGGPAIIADLRLLASTAHQRATAIPQHDQVFVIGWELTRAPAGQPVWRRDTPGGTAYVLRNSGAWLCIVGREELSVRQHATRQEACLGADAVLYGERVSA